MSRTRIFPTILIFIGLGIGLLAPTGIMAAFDTIGTAMSVPPIISR